MVKLLLAMALIFVELTAAFTMAGVIVSSLSGLLGWIRQVYELMVNSVEAMPPEAGAALGGYLLGVFILGAVAAVIAEISMWGVWSLICKGLRLLRRGGA